MLNKSFTLFVFLLFMLNACGGDSSSGPGSSKARLENDGVYEGSQDIKIIDTSGVIVDAQKLGFNMSVFQNTVTFFESSFSTNESIIGDAFSVNSIEIAETTDGVTCNGTISYNGNVVTGSVQGSIRGELVCREAAELPVSFAIEGQFEALRDTISSKISIINDTNIDMTNVVKKVLSF